MQKVYVIDDTMIAGQLVGEILRESEGIEPVLFTNPVEGLAEIRANKDADLVLVDYQMPEMNGLEFISHLRKEFNLEELPIIMITATEEKAFLREAFEAGANDFLRKPVEPVELIARARNLRRLKTITEELQRLANTDVLTNVQTRRSFMEAAETEVGRSHRYGGPLSIIMLDADHFKNVNDTYGHAGGDDVLRFLSAACKEVVRDQDYVGRLGGEEFCICLPETGLEGATKVAERLRQNVEEATINLSDGQKVKVTLSIGVSVLQSKEDLDTVMRRSDEALYEAKEGGRNRVVVAN
ncbi:MAG: diguanylate cyclase [Alphaproteobacteria bacterium]|nr:diguanylate cyclase [Alphaproteobacteria bacterium]